MPRPVSPRNVDHVPPVTWFKPAGVPMRCLDEVQLTVDEVEALRLGDLEGLYQAKAAEQMGVSRSTISRILASARKKVAEALVHGKAIRVEGGAVMLDRDQICMGPEDGSCPWPEGGKRCGATKPEDCPRWRPR